MSEPRSSSSPNLIRAEATKQARFSQPQPNKRVRAYPKRVPSSLPTEDRKSALLTVRAGRSIHQTAADTPCATVVITELWLRDLDRRVLELRDEVRELRAYRRAA